MTRNGITCVEWTEPVTVSLTRGLVALIDPVDAWVTAMKWHAHPARQRRENWYAARTVRHGDGRSGTIYLHQAITRPLGWQMADHINGNGLDCRRCNLRPTNLSLNNANRSYPTNRSGYRGVYFDRGRKAERPWVAQLFVLGKCKNLGSFASPEEAAIAYDDAALKAFGEFARLNFPARSPATDAAA